MADFNLTINYRPGVANRDADGLSRMSIDMEMFMCVQRDTISTTKQGILLQQKEPTPLFSSITFNAIQEQALPEQADNWRLLSRVQAISRDEIWEAQQENPAIGKVWEYKMKNQRPSAMSFTQRTVK